MNPIAHQTAHQVATAFGDLSRADLSAASFQGANLRQARLHRVQDDHTNWRGADRKLVDGTDNDLALAEDYTPPAPLSSVSGDES